MRNTLLTEESPATNSTYPKVAVQWLNQALCIYQSSCLIDSEVLRNRHLRVAANRYPQYKITTSSKKITKYGIIIPYFVYLQSE